MRTAITTLTVALLLCSATRAEDATTKTHKPDALLTNADLAHLKARPAPNPNASVPASVNPQRNSITADQLKALQKAYGTLTAAQTAYNQADLVRYRANDAWQQTVAAVEKQCGGKLKIDQKSIVCQVEAEKSSAPASR